MLQRSPTWMSSRPSEDRLAKRLRRAAAARPRERGDALAAGSPRHVLLRPLPAQSGAGETAAARRRARLDGPGPRARAALHAALRPVAAAPLPGARRRPVPRPAQRPRGDRHRRDRALHADRRAPGRRRGACGRPDRHRDRADAPGLRRRRDQRRRPAGRLAATPQLQGSDVQRRAQPGLGVRLQQRVVDPEVGPDRRVRLPRARAHAAERHAPGDAAQRRPGGRRRALARLLLGLRAALAAPVPAAGLEAAVAAAPELRPRPGRPALDPGRRRGARVLESAPGPGVADRRQGARRSPTKIAPFPRAETPPP